MTPTQSFTNYWDTISGNKKINTDDHFTHLVFLRCLLEKASGHIVGGLLDEDGNTTGWEFLGEPLEASTPVELAEYASYMWDKLFPKKSKYDTINFKMYAKEPKDSDEKWVYASNGGITFVSIVATIGFLFTDKRISICVNDNKEVVYWQVFQD